MAGSTSQGNPSSIEQLLTPVRESLINKPPFVAGSLQLPPSHFSLLYEMATENGHVTRHINFVNVDPGELDQLVQACEPASFGRSKEEVMDETYRKARKMDNDRFSSLLVPEHTDLIKIVRDCLLEGTDSNRQIKVELQKLNVYSEGSFFKAHVDTPRNETMFASIVVAFPTSHEGGVLALRHRCQEWSFDSSAILSAAMPASVAYAAFFCDVEHEILPVKSGHRVTLTYNLYFDVDERASGKHVISELPSIPQEENEQTFRSRFEALLENPEFLPDGGTLGFGLRHVYQVKDTLEHVYGILKGNDATVYQSLRKLGFGPILYLHYKENKDKYCEDEYQTVLMDRIPDLKDHYIEILALWLQELGGIVIPYHEKVTWVTPETAFNAFQREYTAYGNEPSVGLAYGNLCLIVRIGSVGNRLRYPAGTQMRRTVDDW